MAKITLTTPIQRTSTQWEFSKLLLDLVGDRIVARLGLFNGTGGLIETRQLDETLDDLGMPPGEVNALRNRIIARLRTLNIIN